MQGSPSDSAILVTGATGTFGAALVDLLRGQGRAVRVLVRDPARFAAEGVEVFAGDFGDTASLGGAMAGIEAVFLASFDRPAMPALQRNVLEAARRHGVRRVARISSMGVDNPQFGPIMADHLEGERQLEASGLGYTHLRPSWVLQNFLPSSAATPVREGRIRLPAGDGRVSFVDARDVAAVAAVALTEPGHEGAAYELTGPDARTHAELAAALSAASGRAIAYEDLAPEAYVEGLRAAGWPAASIESMNTLFAEIREGAAGVLTDHVKRVTGRQPLSIEDFARDHAPLFAAA